MKNKNESRRSFLRGGLLIGGMSILGKPQVLVGAVGDNVDFAILTGPYLQTGFKNDMQIQWICNKDAHGWIEYGVDKDNLDKVAYGEAKAGLLPAGRIHRIGLQELVPGTTYYYRIVCKEIADFQPYKLTFGKEIKSPIESFLAIDIHKKEVSFLMLNDIHDRPQSINHLLRMDDGRQRDFIFFNGDMFDYQRDERQIINQFLNPIVSSFAKNIPFLYVRGNHETRGSFARNFADYFSEVGYQAFTLGPIRFVVLDSGEDKSDSHPVYGGIVDYDGYRKQQAQWLEQEIARPEFKKAVFRVVLVHMPPVLSEDEWHGSNHAVTMFEPLMNRGKVDLVLSGHIHESKIFKPKAGANTYPIVTGGGPRDGNRTLVRFKADSRKILVEVLNDQGQIIDTLNVSHK